MGIRNQNKTALNQSEFTRDEIKPNKNQFQMTYMTKSTLRNSTQGETESQNATVSRNIVGPGAGANTQRRMIMTPPLSPNR